MNTAEQSLVDKIFKLKERKIEIEKTRVFFRDSSQNEEIVKIDLELSKLDEKHYTEPFVKIGVERLANNE